jgi:metal-sulfur cluster biosynthetic enzyme
MTTDATVTEDHVREILKTVFDPEIGINIVDLGLIYAIEVKESEEHDGKKATDIKAPSVNAPGIKAKVTHTLTTPACPVGPMIRAQIEQAVKNLDGVDEVETELVFSPPWDPKEMCSDEAKFELGIF